MSDRGGKALASLAAFGAAFGARKLITLAWKQVTGKEPPTDPHDPAVGIGEALAWAVLTGVAIETARLLAVRATSKKARQLSGSGD
jgi:hypothetical protein